MITIKYPKRNPILTRKTRQPDLAKVEEALENGGDNPAGEPEPKPDDPEETMVSLSCPICGVDATKSGNPFASWKSVRSHMTTTHSKEVKGKMLTEEDILSWDASKIGMDEPTHTPGVPHKAKLLPDVFQELSSHLALYQVDSGRIMRIIDYMKSSGKDPDDMTDVYQSLQYAQMDKASMKLFIEVWANRRQLEIPQRIYRDLFDDDRKFGYRSRGSGYGYEEDRRDPRQAEELGELRAVNKSLEQKLSEAPTVKEMMQLQMEMARQQNEANRQTMVQQNEAIREMMAQQRENDRVLREKDKEIAQIQVQNERERRQEDKEKHQEDLKRREEDEKKRAVSTDMEQMAAKKLDQSFTRMGDTLQDGVKLFTRAFSSAAVKSGLMIEGPAAPGLSAKPEVSEDEKSVGDIMVELGMGEFVK